MSSVDEKQSKFYRAWGGVFFMVFASLSIGVFFEGYTIHLFVLMVFLLVFSLSRFRKSLFSFKYMMLGLALVLASGLSMLFLIFLGKLYQFFYLVVSVFFFLLIVVWYDGRYEIQEHE